MEVNQGERREGNGKTFWNLVSEFVRGLIKFSYNLHFIKIRYPPDLRCKEDE